MPKKRGRPRLLCEYRKEANGYVSGCGIRAAYNKMWHWCPYCGKVLIVITRKANEEEE